jgi:hypothetical protein
MKRLGNESGQTLVMVALSMAVLLGFTAFATDVGIMLHEKRQVQSAADSAAIAAAWGLSDNTGAVAAGEAAATANGFTQGTDSNGYTTTVHIYATPIDGHFAGQSGYTEAVITQQIPTFFMHVFGKNSATIGARAVATDKGSGDSCFRTNNISGTTMVFQGSFHDDLPGCLVENMSSDSCAADFVGGAGRITSAGFSIVGQACGKSTDSTPLPTEKALATSDPLALMPPPQYGTSDTPCTTTTSLASTTMDAGGGTVCYQNLTGDINLTNVTLNNGTYVFDTPTGTLVLNGNITGSNVTLYLTGGLNETAGTVLTLSQSSDTNHGVLLWDTSTYTGSTSGNSICVTGQGNAGPGVIQLNIGNSSGTFSGVIYAPKADLVFHDSGSDSDGPDLITDIDVGTMCDETADINITDFASNHSGVFPKIALVE